jgi:hypothetical protein
LSYLPVPRRKCKPAPYWETSFNLYLHIAYIASPVPDPISPTMDTHVWPNFVRTMDWPKEGTTYSYEHRGYIRPEKVELWLLKAFGPGKAKFVVRCLLFFSLAGETGGRTEVDALLFRGCGRD